MGIALEGKWLTTACPGKVNFTLSQVKIEVDWPEGQSEISLSSLVSLNKNVSL